MILSDLSPRGTLHGVIFRGGGGGVSDYDDLTNRPKINNITLTGNKNASDLGLADPSDIKFTGINQAAGWSIYRARNITVEGLVYDVAYPEFTGTDGVDPGTNGLVKCPEATDYGKFLAASGGWENVPDPSDISQMTWNLLISQAGGALSNYTSVGDSKYLVVYADYQGVSYAPFIYKVSELDKILQVSGNGELAQGYNWKVGSSYDEWEFHYKSDGTAAIKAGYSGITMKLYGVQ